jgi:hypothetical protein
MGSMRLIIERTIIVIVHLIASFLFDVVSLFVLVFNPVVRISVVDNVVQVPVVPFSSLVALLWGSQATGRVLAWALAVVRILTPRPIYTLEGRVNHDSYIQHFLEALDLLNVFRQ